MNETIRDRIKRQMRWATALVVGGWLIVAVTMSIVGPQNDVPGFVVGMCLFGVGLLFTTRVTCPKCKRRVGHEIGYRVAFGWMGKPPDYCPYCGTSLDEPRP